jgi:hypothetical protein
MNGLSNIISDLEQQHSAISEALSALRELDYPSAPDSEAPSSSLAVESVEPNGNGNGTASVKTPRKFSAESRRKMAASQRRRWAKQRRAA